jgi:hypothetical protein
MSGFKTFGLSTIFSHTQNGMLKLPFTVLACGAPDQRKPARQLALRLVPGRNGEAGIKNPTTHPSLRMHGILMDESIRQIVATGDSRYLCMPPRQQVFLGCVQAGLSFLPIYPMSY